MRPRYLEVTFRRGRPIAAYLYLPRTPGAKVARTTDEGGGIRVDLDDAGTPMGIEITAPAVTSAEQINAVLLQFGQPRLDGDDWAPLRAA